VTLLGRHYENIRKSRYQYSWQFKKKTWVKEDWSHIDPRGTTAGLNKTVELFDRLPSSM